MLHLVRELKVIICELESLRMTISKVININKKVKHLVTCHHQIYYQYGLSRIFRLHILVLTIFLYTRASTRYMYLDLVPEYYSRACIRALAKLFCNLGVPKLVLSGNGRQFLSLETQNFVSTNGIT